MSSRTDANARLSKPITERLRQLTEIQTSTARNPQPVGIIGPGDGGDILCRAAYEVASALASANVPIVCGGRAGVMGAACQGAYEMGGTTIGILPEEDLRSANPYVNLALPTGIGEMRNVLIVRSSVCLVAIGGGMGTLSEVALGLKWGKPVFTLHEEFRLPGTQAAAHTEQLLEWVIECLISTSASRP